MGEPDDPVVWLCHGTHVSTPHGERRVELLAAGDLVRTGAGLDVGLLWCTERSYTGFSLAANAGLQPAVVCEDAVAPGVPRRDLWAAPELCLMLDGVAAPLASVTNGDSIRHPLTFETVRYTGLLLPPGCSVVAEGVPVAAVCPADAAQIAELRSRLAARAVAEQSLMALMAVMRSEAGATAA